MLLLFILFLVDALLFVVCCLLLDVVVLVSEYFALTLFFSFSPDLSLISHLISLISHLISSHSDTGNEERKKRYGDKKNENGKKKHHIHKKKSSKKHKHHQSSKGPETDSLSSLSSSASKLSLPTVKPPKGGLRKTPSYVAAVKEANKHHGDAGDGGVPDELVAMMGDDFLGDFHYGKREF